ncbi:MAG TPA: PBP1A family penicillin-binding protein [Thermoanaerobaculia bacterium]|nr:PBP1A family penicillin-binding protein [Thermoanaerobaculia bacterium]
MSRSKSRIHGLRAFLRRPRVRLALAALALVFVAFAGWLIWPFWQLSGQFDEQPTHQPSRLFARSTTLVAGEPLDLDAIVEELGELAYREASDGTRLPPGTYHAGDGRLAVHLRRFPTPKGMGGGVVLVVEHDGRRVRRLEMGGQEVPAAWLEPVLLASYFDDDLEERRPLTIAEVPEEVVWAVLAAEDANFYRHGGLSPTGILRAAWVNVRGGEVRQGGSTLTQQLVKNLYLTHERTLSRKMREAVLAVLLEARYTKAQILQAYLNEIYMGASNGVNLIGFGAAARAYFGKAVGELSLAEAATLAGVIQSPANYDPVRHPEAARERRDWVLDRMVEAGFLDEERAAWVGEQEVVAHPRPVVRRRAPWFADHVAREAAERYGLAELEDAGYQLLSTLDWRDQEEAVEAVAWGIETLEKGWEKGHEGSPLQAALVSLDPESGGIRAYVGGRSYEGSQFDRAGQALRQAGSAFKPVVYAAAFADGKAYPSSFLEDAPLTVRQASQRWSPQNYDGTFHGWVTVRTAMEDSLNVATARLALQVGLPRIVEMARRLGIDAPLQPVPSIALGAFEVNPLDLAQVYAVFAAGGVRPPLHGLEAVLDPHGRPLDGTPLPERERVITPETAYLMTSLLQGVVDHGTAAAARRMGVEGPLAGKTGTTNDRRDSWFGGYSPDRASVVWVGYDDNSPTSLSGSRAAVPIWARFVQAVRPPGGYRNFEQPPGVTTATIDPTTGLLATEACPYQITEVFPRGGVPNRVCHVHRYGGWFDRWGRRADGEGPPDGGWNPDGAPPGAPPPVAEEEEREEERRGGFRNWLRRVFDDDDQRDGEDRRRRNGDDGGGDGGDGGDGGQAPDEAPAP